MLHVLTTHIFKSSHNFPSRGKFKLTTGSFGKVVLLPNKIKRT